MDEFQVGELRCIEGGHGRGLLRKGRGIIAKR
jgi:hypothetical protein